MERETGIEPATNSLEGCDSTTELLPPTRSPIRRLALRRAGPPLSCRLVASRVRRAGQPRSLITCDVRRCLPAEARRVASPMPLAASPVSLAARAKVGGEGRTRTFEAARATDLQSAAFDRFATSPKICLIGIRVFDAYCVCCCLFLSVFVAFRGCEFDCDFCAWSGLELAKGFEPPTC